MKKEGGFMKLAKQIKVAFVGLSLVISASGWTCTTQTVIVGGKMTVCTVCGTVVSCM